MRPTLTIIGNIFVDLKGISFGQVIPDTKNVGKVEISHGGAARNAVHNLAVLGANARFLSSYNEDATGKDVVSVLQAAGVDISYMRGYPAQGMGRWLAVLNSEGELVASISEQPLLSNQEQTILTNLDRALEGTQAVGIDIGISSIINEITAAACKKLGLPLYGLVGNLDVLKQNPRSLSGFTAFVCNEEEASVLIGEELKKEEDLKNAAVKLAEYGTQKIVITRAEKGVLYYDHSTGQFGHTPARPAQLVDSTGAGDSFFSGLIYAQSLGFDFASSVDFGCRVAARVIEGITNTLDQPLQVETPF